MVNHQRLVHLLFLSALLLLSGCSLQPSDAASGGDQSGSDQSATGEPEENVCEYPSDSPSDDFMLGLQALSEGDYAAAGQHFEKHALSGGERSPREAAAGQALADTLSQYPIEEDLSTADEVTDRAMLIDLVLVVLGKELVVLGKELELELVVQELELVVLEQEIGKLADFPAACSLVASSMHGHFVLEHETCGQLEYLLTLIPAQFAFARRIV